MAADLYRYHFDAHVSAEDIESALLLAVWGCEALHGEAQTRLDGAHYFDSDARSCVVDASTPVGKSFNQLFVGFLRREFGEDVFRVERVTEPMPQTAV